MGTEAGLNGVAREVVGVDIDRIKNLAMLHKRNSFDKMTDKELVFGKVQVSDWAREKISSDQAYYGLFLDSKCLMIISCYEFKCKREKSNKYP